MGLIRLWELAGELWLLTVPIHEVCEVMRPAGGVWAPMLLVHGICEAGWWDLGSNGGWLVGSGL